MIDLGVLPAADADDPPPPPAPAAGRPRWPVGWVAAAVGAMVLLTTTASAPQPPWAVPHFTVPTSEQAQDEIALTEDMLYVLGRSTEGAGETTIAAYRLSDGTLRWQQAADFAYVWQGKPILSWTGGNSSVGPTAWLDPETGEPRWRGDGHVTAISPDWTLVSTPHMPPDARVDDIQWYRSSVTVVDRRSGREIWSLPPVDGVTVATSGEPHRLVVVDGDRLRSYEPATGELLASRQLRRLQAGWEPSIVGQVVVLLQQHEITQATLHAYDVESLEPLWTREANGGVRGMARCGELICLLSGHRAEAMDPVTGRQRWSLPFPPDDFLDADWLPGYLVATGPDRAPYRLLDAATGEVVFEFGEWSPHYGDGTEALVTRYEPNLQPVVVELGRGQQEVRFRELGRTWFARLHLDPAPRLELLGAVDSGFGSCTSGTGTAGTGYVACAGADEVTVWRVP